MAPFSYRQSWTAYFRSLSGLALIARFSALYLPSHLYGNIFSKTVFNHSKEPLSPSANHFTLICKLPGTKGGPSGEKFVSLSRPEVKTAFFLKTNEYKGEPDPQSRHSVPDNIKRNTKIVHVQLDEAQQGYWC